MKFYETHYEEYLQSLDRYNMHPELSTTHQSFPREITQVDHTIFYGPTGVGKYTQLLHFLRPYSPSQLKYDKKIRLQTEKASYTYRISDIHYEIDMSLLGCNSKLLWHEVFFQIVDIVTMKSDKAGIIVCKNFHTIHNELLEVFYSYMQQCKLLRPNIHLCFWILTEHVSFLPNNILNCCELVRISRPPKKTYTAMMKARVNMRTRGRSTEPSASFTWNDFIHKTTSTNIHPDAMKYPQSIDRIVHEIDQSCILNTKELHAFTHVSTADELPKDIFNIICDNILNQLLNPQSMAFAEFRDHLYDILVYNLEITDCIWYILHYLIQNDHLKHTNMRACMEKVHIFLKQYNNNYRPIYHLESIFFYFITEIHPAYHASNTGL